MAGAAGARGSPVLFGSQQEIEFLRQGFGNYLHMVNELSKQVKHLQSTVAALQTRVSGMTGNTGKTGQTAECGKKRPAAASSKSSPTKPRKTVSKDDAKPVKPMTPMKSFFPAKKG